LHLVIITNENMKIYFNLNKLLLLLALLVLVSSCDSLLPKLPEQETVLDGPLDGLTYEQKQLHLKGDAAFNDEIFTGETGLGPIFVANSCGSCHAGDGKGHPFTTLTRFGQTDSTGNKFLEQGGPQLQNRALPGIMPEVIPSGAKYSNFTPPAVSGFGFIELVPDDDILAMEDPDDADGDGISGVANWHTVPSYVVARSTAISQNGKLICRFGKKAGAYNLLQQTANAYNQDMGVNSDYEPIDVYTNQFIGPEVSAASVNAVVFYLQTLKAPQQRNVTNAEVQNGKTVFNKIACGGCHKETLKTGYSPITPLSNKEFHPYTDLLLHDMGSGLDDGYTEGSAKTYEWRTPALWGLGLSVNSQGGSYFLMHDGRAKSIEEAILLHGGEALRSKNSYQSLSEQEKNNLIKFLKSL